MNRRENLIQETLAEWQKDYKESLTARDADEIISSVSGYFRLLDKWAQEEDSLKHAGEHGPLGVNPSGGLPSGHSTGLVYSAISRCKDR